MNSQKLPYLVNQPLHICVITLLPTSLESSFWILLDDKSTENSYHEVLFMETSLENSQSSPFTEVTLASWVLCIHRGHDTR